jgi:hypothetical protein
MPQLAGSSDRNHANPWSEQLKKKVKVTVQGFSIPRLLRSIVSEFISRGATHHTDVRDFYQRRRELFPPSFASRSVIYKNPLGSFTCCKAGTWDILFYFLSEGRYTEAFPDARKIQRLRPGLNPRTRVPVASMLTTRPLRPSSEQLLSRRLFNDTMNIKQECYHVFTVLMDKVCQQCLGGQRTTVINISRNMDLKQMPCEHKAEGLVSEPTWLV